MLEAFKKMWINGLNFKDRTSRGDFWITYFGIIIFTIILGFFALGIISAFISETLANILYYVYFVLIFVPLLSMEVRRLHDVNKSGWYMLVELIPLVGWIFVLVAFCSKTVEPNKYGKQI